MLFGSDEEVKKLKTAFGAAGADMSIVKAWLKTYEKTRKEALTCMGRYYSGKDNLEKLISGLEELEKMIRGYRALESGEKNSFQSIIKDFKKMQGSFNDEFLISKEDKDFHTTLESVIKLAPSYVNKGENGVILQSEIENLMALAKEGIERERPELFALSYFYLEHTNADLAELNFSQKVDKVTRIYNEGLIKPIQGQLVLCIKQAQATNDRYEGTTDKKTLKLLDELSPFIEAGDDQMTPEARAQILLRKICRV